MKRRTFLRQLALASTTVTPWDLCLASSGPPPKPEAARIIASRGEKVVLQSGRFRYTIAADGRNLAFIDRKSGIDYLRRDPPSACALVRLGGKEYPVTSAALSKGRLTLRFDPPAIQAVIKLEPRASWVRLTVESVRGAEVDSVVFLNVPLTLEGKPEESFGACALSLNLITRVDQLPALQSELRATAHRKFGIVGAKVALVGVGPKYILAALKDALSSADEMPLCKVAGPWAQEVPFSHGSYLFNFGSLTEATTDAWIEMARSLGFTQIDNHGGGESFFRFGDFELNRKKWPHGWETYRRIVARLHVAGIGSIFHTYAFFIDKHSKYVSPVPDRRLDAFRTFTLATDLAADSDTLFTNESTAGLNTVTGFFEHNSIVLHLGDELVTFGAAAQRAPWGFTGVKRGVLGTKASAHQQGATARHLKECFGLFVPDPESSLFLEIAANHASVVNQCGFDGIYLDAIDGSSILRGEEECWFWADKFVMEIQRRLEKPVGMEMSSMWHHFWQYRTRWQAWDYPQRGHKRFVDLHAQTLHGGLLLPLHLGWWNFQSFNPPQVEPTYPDVIECLGARLVGWDAGISLTGAVDREQLQSVPLFRRATETLRACEEIRHEGSLGPAAKAALREPGSEFTLVADAKGRRQFRRSHSEPHTVAMAEAWTQSWSVTNPYGGGRMKVRIEALMSAGSYDEPTALVIGALVGAEAGKWETSAAQGVVATVVPPAAESGRAEAVIQARSSGKVQRQAAWACYRKRFEPVLNLKERQALGVWIDGDGLGELVAIRLESPQHLAFGAVADRYVLVDFTGRRYFTLVETESSRWSDYTWNDGKGVYNVYRESINFGAVESISIWFQNLPPGQMVQSGLSRVKALPMRATTLRDPTLTINGRRIAFPTELTSGSWLEFDGLEEFVLYGPKGETLGKLKPSGAPAILQAGSNQVQFSCAPTAGAPPRAKVTFFMHGPLI